MTKSGNKAKTASKNNPTLRTAAKVFSYNGQKIKPVKVTNENNSTFMAAEYENGDLVLDSAGRIITWALAIQQV